MGKRRTFSAEFKQEAVQLAKQPDTSVKEVARNLDLDESVLRRWILAHDRGGPAPAFPGKGKPGLTPEQAEIKRLQRELEVARQERDILKKAVAFFAKESR